MHSRSRQEEILYHPPLPLPLPLQPLSLDL
jgi:hypothetical protein